MNAEDIQDYKDVAEYLYAQILASVNDVKGMPDGSACPRAFLDWWRELPEEERAELAKKLPE